MKYIKLVAIAGVLLLAVGVYGCLDEVGEPPVQEPDEPIMPEEPEDIEEPEGLELPENEEDAEEIEGLPVH